VSDNVLNFPVTIPAGTAIATPVTVQAPLGICDLVELRVVIPPGPAGLVGFVINGGGSQIFPIGRGTWFIFDDYVYDQAVSNQINSGQWSITAYNLDVFPHTLQFYFYTNDITYSPGPDLSAPVSL
jgi:hypothetical protein